MRLPHPPEGHPGRGLGTDCEDRRPDRLVLRRTTLETRGWLDRIVGGMGLKRGRRASPDLYVGDALDFWRVLDLEAPYRLVLLSEMKLPGEAILEFTITPVGPEETELQQLSRFVPKGFAGLVYWYSLYFPHHWLFRGMLRTIARAVGKPLLEGPKPFIPELRWTCPIGNGRQ